MLAASFLPVSTLKPVLNVKSSPSNSFSSESSTDSTSPDPDSLVVPLKSMTEQEDEEALAERFGRILGLGNQEVDKTLSEEDESNNFWGAMNRARRVYSGQSSSPPRTANRTHTEVVMVASIFAHTESQWTASRAEIEQRGSMKHKEKSKSLW